MARFAGKLHLPLVLFTSEGRDSRRAQHSTRRNIQIYARRRGVGHRAHPHTDTLTKAFDLCYPQWMSQVGTRDPASAASGLTDIDSPMPWPDQGANGPSALHSSGHWSKGHLVLSQSRPPPSRINSLVSPSLHHRPHRCEYCTVRVCHSPALPITCVLALQITTIPPI
jgi:hypothetical protein